MKPETIAASYKTLRLPPDVGMDAVKRAFHSLAAQHHPDANAQSIAASERFKKISHAYDILKKHLRLQQRGQPPEPARGAVPPSRRAKQPKSFVMPASDILPLNELRVRVRHSQNRFVRLHAVRALTAHGKGEGVWCLIWALSDSDAEVRREAIRALGALRAPVAVMPLIYTFKTVDFFTRDTILHALARIDTPLATKFLRYMRFHPDSAERNDSGTVADGG